MTKMMRILADPHPQHWLRPQTQKSRPVPAAGSHAVWVRLMTGLGLVGSGPNGVNKDGKGMRAYLMDAGI